MKRGLRPNRLPRKTLLRTALEGSKIEQLHEHEFQVSRPVITELPKKEQKFKKGLQIEAIDSERDSVKEKPIQKGNILPGMGLFIICGATGSGKSVMVANLLGNKHMLKGWWDEIYMFCLSPSKMLTDILKLKDDHIIREDRPELLRKILDEQKSKIEAKGYEKAPKILIICDDVAQSRKFLKHEVLQEIAFASTHAKVSVWITTQSYMQIPRNVRINAHYIAIFSGVKRSEIERIKTEHESQYLSDKEMDQLIRHATADPYSFLFINNRVADKRQVFRKNFDTILHLKK